MFKRRKKTKTRLNVPQMILIQRAHDRLGLDMQNEIDAKKFRANARNWYRRSCNVTDQTESVVDTYGLLTYVRYAEAVLGLPPVE